MGHSFCVYTLCWVSTKRGEAHPTSEANKEKAPHSVMGAFSLVEGALCEEEDSNLHGSYPTSTSS